MNAIDTFYATLSDKEDRGPQAYGGNAQVASLRAFRRYHKDAHVDITDGDGMTRWLAPKQVRVFGIIHRIAMSPTGTAKMVDIALEAGCTPSTVSRTVHKLERWAMFAVEIRRGRNGGITVHRKGWERFWDVVYAARVKLASTLRRRKGRVNGAGTVTVPSMDATFSGSRVMTFADRVFYERAMLALEDPEGEKDAVHPLIGSEAIDKAFKLQDERRRISRQMEKAALASDWDVWQELMELRNRIGTEE